MAKLVGRIPASRVKLANSWSMPALTGEKVIKASGLIAPGRIQGSVGERSAEDGLTSAMKEGAVQASVIKPKQRAVQSSQTESNRQTLVPSGEGEVAYKNQPSDNNEDNCSQKQQPENLPAAVSSPELPIAPEQHYSEGYLQGQKDGYAEGEEKGFIEGERKGEASGYKTGMERGRKDGAVEALGIFNDEISGKRELLASLLNIREPLEQINADLTNALVPLVTGIAEAVLNVELNMRPELIRNYVTESLNAMPHTTAIVELTVHPDAVPFLSELPILEQWHVKIVEDRSLAMGGCRVSSSHSAVDQTLSQRLRDCLLTVFSEDSDDKEIRSLTSEAELNDISQLIQDSRSYGPESAVSGPEEESIVDELIQGNEFESSE